MYQCMLSSKCQTVTMNSFCLSFHFISSINYNIPLHSKVYWLPRTVAPGIRGRSLLWIKNCERTSKKMRRAHLRHLRRPSAFGAASRRSFATNEFNGTHLISRAHGWLKLHYNKKQYLIHRPPPIWSEMHLVHSAIVIHAVKLASTSTSRISGSSIPHTQWVMWKMKVL